MIAQDVRRVELLHDRTLRVEPLRMSGVTPRSIWAFWYETSETILVRVVDTGIGAWWAEKDGIYLVPPHSVEPIALLDQTVYVCHEANLIARIEGSGR
jgi:hypothetical protein